MMQLVWGTNQAPTELRSTKSRGDNAAPTLDFSDRQFKRPCYSQPLSLTPNRSYNDAPSNRLLPPRTIIQQFKRLSPLK